MDNKTPLLYVKIFFALVIIAAIISIFYKSFQQFQSSSFKNDTFNLLYTGETNTIVHVDGAERKIVVYKLPKKANISGKTRMGRSANLGVLIDGEISGSKQNVTDDNFMNLSSLISYWSGGAKLDNINNYDLLKMFYISKMTSVANRTTIDKPTITSFSDPKILDEGLSVAVINASEIDGLGSKVSDALKSAGFNVVSVGSTDKAKSQIKTNRLDSKTLTKLKSSIKAPVKKTDQKITDITLVVGEDIIK